MESGTSELPLMEKESSSRERDGDDARGGGSSPPISR